MPASSDEARALELVLEQEHGAILAHLVRSTDGDFASAEDALQEACAQALTTWGVEGLPAKPAAWLQLVAKRRLSDLTRQHRRAERSRQADVELDALAARQGAVIEADIVDDTLPLLFACCHPALAENARVALILNALCGMTAARIARAFLSSEATIAQRLLRAKNKIKASGIAIAVPAAIDAEQAHGTRLLAVLRALYLLFNEGYATSSGKEHIATQVCEHAILWTTRVVDAFEEAAEAKGLLALMRFQHARRDARIAGDGSVVLLRDQDRTAWRHDEIEEAARILDSAARMFQAGSYQIQAAIAYAHASAASFGETDWATITRLYDRLLSFEDSPVIRLNRCAAVFASGDAKRASALLDELEADGRLGAYSYYWATRGEICLSSGRLEEARRAFVHAGSLTENEAERRFLLGRAVAAGAP